MSIEGLIAEIATAKIPTTATSIELSKRGREAGTQAATIFYQILRLPCTVRHLFRRKKRYDRRDRIPGQRRDRRLATGDPFCPRHESWIQATVLIHQAT